jgi:hypothetical protein
MNTHSIREPIYPVNEAKVRGCLSIADDDTHFLYYVNRQGLQELRWSFWYNYAESPYYEDPSIPNAYYAALTSRERWVRYAETTIIKDEDILTRDQDYPLGYRRLHDSIDLYVTKDEFRAAFDCITRLRMPAATDRPAETIIFRYLSVILLPTSRFV